MRRIVLASTSPRRHELLRAAGMAFVVVPIQVEEGPDPMANALAKAGAAGPQEDPVVAADTVVRVGGQQFDKPRDREEAAAMLGALQGRTHEVTTAVAILWRGRAYTFCERSLVTLPPMTPEEIRDYHRRVDPLDKAGAYALQELPQARVEGSRSNVMGLPVERLCQELARLDSWAIC